MTKLLFGKPAADRIRTETNAIAERLALRGLPKPRLAVALVEGDKGTDAYADSILRGCAGYGVDADVIALPETVNEAQLLATLDRLNGDDVIDGVLLMRPLPHGMDERRICNAILPEKDVDGVTDASLAGVFTGAGAGYAPCTAEACITLLDEYGVDVCGKRAVIVGRSLVVGRPLAMLLLARNATVTLCHTKTEKLAEEAQRADILIAAAGRPHMVNASFVQAGATVLDVGTNVLPDGTLTGDVDFAPVSAAVSAITPVPRGVGSVTTAVLMRHTALAAAKRRGL